MPIKLGKNRPKICFPIHSVISSNKAFRHSEEKVLIRNRAIPNAVGPFTSDIT
jgi:hypothetical protein